VSPNEFIAMLTSNGLTARYMEENDNTHYVEVSEGGAMVYFALRACTGAGLTARCGTVQPFGYFSATGVTLAQINDFNLQRPNVAFAGLDDAGRGIIGAKFYLQAGVSADHIPFSIGLFFADIDLLLGSINPGALADVAYEQRAPAASKIANHAPGFADDEFRLASGEPWRTNSVGANAPSFQTDAFRALLART